MPSINESEHNACPVCGRRYDKKRCEAITFLGDRMAQCLAYAKPNHAFCTSHIEVYRTRAIANKGGPSLET